MVLDAREESGCLPPRLRACWTFGGVCTGPAPPRGSSSCGGAPGARARRQLWLRSAAGTGTPCTLEGQSPSPACGRNKNTRATGDRDGPARLSPMEKGLQGAHGRGGSRRRHLERDAPGRQEPSPLTAATACGRVTTAAATTHLPTLPEQHHHHDHQQQERQQQQQ